MKQGPDVFFLLMGAILVFAMHGGFAFLETGTVRHKNQVNALVKILVDFAVSTIAYFVIGYTVAYGVSFYSSAAAISGGAPGFQAQGYTLVRFFFLCTFAAAVPAIVSGGIAERAKFTRRPWLPQPWWRSATPCLRASTGTRTSDCRSTSSKMCSAPSSRISPGQLSSTPLAAG